MNNQIGNRENRSGKIPDHRLPKSEILRKKNEISKLFQSGKRWEGQFFNIYFLVADHRKAGFMVSKRLGNAVFRNRAKRRMREIFRKHKEMVGSYSLVFFAKRAVCSSPYFQLEQEFLLFLRQTHVGIRP